MGHCGLEVVMQFIALSGANWLETGASVWLGWAGAGLRRCARALQADLYCVEMSGFYLIFIIISKYI